MEEHIEITCYGKKEVWKTREVAMKFYLDLMSGKTECFDEEQDETDLPNVQDMNL